MSNYDTNHFLWAASRHSESFGRRGCFKLFTIAWKNQRSAGFEETAVKGGIGHCFQELLAKKFQFRAVSGKRGLENELLILKRIQGESSSISKSSTTSSL